MLLFLFTTLYHVVGEIGPGGGGGGGGGERVPPVNGLRMMPAARGSPSWTSDSKAPTSSKAKAYALPSAMFAWMIRAYWLVGLLR